MILSDEGIRRAITAGEIVISPTPTDSQYTTSAVDLIVGKTFQQWDPRLCVAGEKCLLDLEAYNYQGSAKAHLVPVKPEPDGKIVLAPGQFMLGITREKVVLKYGARLAARVEGRSSLARLGLVVHLTAPTIHAGFGGQITLEMINNGIFHLQLTPDRTRICQLIFERLETLPLRKEPQTQFQNQISPSGEKRKRGRAAARAHE
jgi:dCTP deaminase